MSMDCCALGAVAPRAPTCPESGETGEAVKWLTIAALSRGAVPPRQGTWLCPNPECDVVYFGDRGLKLSTAQVRWEPELVCHCFRHLYSEVEEEVLATGESSILESIRAQVLEKSCACEVRNPTGKCCLKNVRRVVDEAKKRKGSS